MNLIEIIYGWQYYRQNRYNLDSETKFANARKHATTYVTLTLASLLFVSIILLVNMNPTLLERKPQGWLNKLLGKDVVNIWQVYIILTVAVAYVAAKFAWGGKDSARRIINRFKGFSEQRQKRIARTAPWVVIAAVLFLVAFLLVVLLAPG